MLRTVCFQLSIHDILEKQNYGDSKKMSGRQGLGGDGCIGELMIFRVRMLFYVMLQW